MVYAYTVVVHVVDTVLYMVYVSSSMYHHVYHVVDTVDGMWCTQMMGAQGGCRYPHIPSSTTC